MMLTHDDREYYREMVNDGEGVDDPKQVVCALLDEVDRLRRCVNDIVDFRRVEQHEETTSRLRRIEGSMNECTAAQAALCGCAPDAVQAFLQEVIMYHVHGKGRCPGCQLDSLGEHRPRCAFKAMLDSRSAKPGTEEATVQ